MFHETKKIPDSERIIGERRGIFTPTGVPILIAPTREQLAGLPKDPRLRYFSTLGSVPIVLDVDLDGRFPNSIGAIDSPYFKKYCLEPLNKKLREDFPQKPAVAVRGAACSVESTIPYINIMNNMASSSIRSIAQIMQDGTDSGSGRLERNVTIMELREDISTEGYAAGYMQYYSRLFRSLLKMQNDNPNAVFPLFLVYDLKFFDQENNIIKLPRILDGKDKPLLKAYILDYPNF